MYVKLFRDMLDSTLWMQPDHVVRVWLTLLLLADREGFVEVPVPALASRARVSLEHAIESIEVLEAPDEFSRTDEEEGRRILRITEEKTLWKIVNYEFYRKMRTADQKRQYQKMYMRDWRKKRKEEDSHGEENQDSTSRCDEKVHELAHADADADAEGKKKTTSSSRDDLKKAVDFILTFWEEEELSPRLMSISKTRRSNVRGRLKEHGFDAIKAVLESRRDSNFLCNVIFDGKGAGFDWVFGPKNFVKILDGNYADKGTGGTGGGFSEYDGKL